MSNKQKKIALYKLIKSTGDLDRWLEGEEIPVSKVIDTIYWVGNLGSEHKNLYEYMGYEWLVLTDKEADKEAKKVVERIFWDFDSSFLEKYLPIQKQTIEAIKDDLYWESAPIFRYMMTQEAFDKMAKKVIKMKGRGSLLSGYQYKDVDLIDIDGDEEKSKAGSTTYYIYLQNG